MTHPSCGQRRAANADRPDAFTIIEMLTVITIILILAGLILGIAGNAQNKAASARAQGEISALEAAANSYKIDNGTFPRTTDTDTLNAQQNADPAGSSSPYVKSSLALYKMLSGNYYTDSNGNLTYWQTGNAIPKPTVYYQFKDSQLQDSGNVTSGYVDPTTVTATLDPFGFSYGYSTIAQVYADGVAAGTISPGTTQSGYNPTFDLWSTASYSPTAGKPYPTTGSGSTQATYNTLWIKNW